MYSTDNKTECKYFDSKHSFSWPFYLLTKFHSTTECIYSIGGRGVKVSKYVKVMVLRRWSPHTWMESYVFLKGGGGGVSRATRG